jgi:hypothetical protein
MESLAQSLEVNGLGRIAKDIEAAAMPSVFLVPGEPSEDPCSRLGGRPNLPADLAWPSWQGEPLPFVAQLDLAGIPQVEGLSLPCEGSLFFFYEGGLEAWGFTPEHAGGARVLYATSNLSEHPLRAFPDGVADEMRFVGTRLKPDSGHVTLPNDQDQAVERLGLNAEERERYADFLETWRPQDPPLHRMGGHPEPVQGDPKLEAQLASRGLDCGSPGGYERGKELGLWAGATNWKLLLQVDSDESAGMLWGDAGCLYFLIREQDLAQAKFDKVWLILQCG